MLDVVELGEESGQRPVSPTRRLSFEGTMKHLYHDWVYNAVGPAKNTAPLYRCARCGAFSNTRKRDICEGKKS